MFVKDYYLHSTFADHPISAGMQGKKVSIIKKDIRQYHEDEGGTRIFTLNQLNYEDEMVISMSYDEVVLALQEKVC